MWKKKTEKDVTIDMSETQTMSRNIIEFPDQGKKACQRNITEFPDQGKKVYQNLQ